MKALWTIASSIIYIGGTLGPDGIMTGKIACTALLIAFATYGGFMLIDYASVRFAR